jgi:hypothetical protein
MKSIVCPWCQNEIRPEEDETPEFCPICENELGDYRTMEITLDMDPEEAEAEAGGRPGGAAGSKAAAGPAAEPKATAGAAADRAGAGTADGQRTEAGKSGERALPEDAELREIGGEDMLLFRAAVDKWLETQREVPECPSCREYLIESGTLQIGPEGFRPYTPPKAGQPVLDASFEVTVYACPSCFSVHFVLSEKDRAAIIRKGGLFSQSLDLM